MAMKVPPHNMALQRTRRPRFRSGRSLRSLGSPLNARPLGAGKTQLAVGAGCLFFTFLASACHSGPSLQEYRRQLASAAGPRAADCGVVWLGSAKTEAVSCARAALAEHRPFFVAFQVLGFDSQIVHGLAVNETGQATRFMWDSDKYGGRYRIATESWVDQKPCARPSVVSTDRPIRCS